ncbi:hypothetical protein JCM11641_004043 [Rhodosporidiobolus odoratus]
MSTLAPRRNPPRPPVPAQAASIFVPSRRVSPPDAPAVGSTSRRVGNARQVAAPRPARRNIDHPTRVRPSGGPTSPALDQLVASQRREKEIRDLEREWRHSPETMAWVKRQNLARFSLRTHDCGCKRQAYANFHFDGVSPLAVVLEEAPRRDRLQLKPTLPAEDLVALPPVRELKVCNNCIKYANAMRPVTLAATNDALSKTFEDPLFELSPPIYDGVRTTPALYLPAARTRPRPRRTPLSSASTSRRDSISSSTASSSPTLSSVTSYPWSSSSSLASPFSSRATAKRLSYSTAPNPTSLRRPERVLKGFTIRTNAEPYAPAFTDANLTVYTPGTGEPSLLRVEVKVPPPPSFAEVKEGTRYCGPLPRHRMRPTKSKVPSQGSQSDWVSLPPDQLPIVEARLEFILGINKLWERIPKAMSAEEVEELRLRGQDRVGRMWMDKKGKDWGWWWL